MAKDQARRRHRRDKSGGGHSFPLSDTTITYDDVATTTFCWFPPARRRLAKTLLVISGSCVISRTTVTASPVDQLKSAQLNFAPTETESP
jgi:hypothetical protein